jgi:IS30 family transposase
MGKGTRLTEYERGQIDGLLDSGRSIQNIATTLARSYTVVRNYVSNRDKYGKKAREVVPTN